MPKGKSAPSKTKDVMDSLYEISKQTDSELSAIEKKYPTNVDEKQAAEAMGAVMAVLQKHIEASDKLFSSVPKEKLDALEKSVEELGKRFEAYVKTLPQEVLQSGNIDAILNGATGFSEKEKKTIYAVSIDGEVRQTAQQLMLFAMLAAQQQGEGSEDSMSSAPAPSRMLRKG